MCIEERKPLEGTAIQEQIVAVHNNEKQGWIVIFIVFGGAFLLLVIGALSSGRQNHAHALNGVRSSMERSYAEISTNMVKGQNGGVHLIGTDELREAFCGKNAGELKFPSFLPTQELWISKELVSLKSTNLLCVGRAFDERNYGIDGNGLFRRVEDEEFVKWPHVSAQKTGESAGKIP